MRWFSNERHLLSRSEGPEFNPQDPPGGRREPNPASCPLTAHAHSSVPGYILQRREGNKYMQNKSLKHQSGSSGVQRITMPLGRSEATSAATKFPVTIAHWGRRWPGYESF